MNEIKIENVSYKHGNIYTLKNVNLNIHSNEFLGVVGPNGGGKTTLLKLLLGLLKPYEGTITFNNNNNIGYVPQFNYFDKKFPINVMDVVLMGKLSNKIKWFNKYTQKDKEYAEKVLENLNLISLKNRQIGQLSGGQLQKVLIARALIANPKILILDEPTASLDFKNKKDIYELLKELNKNITIIIASHDIHDIFYYVSSICCVDKSVKYFKHNENNKEKVWNYFYNKIQRDDQNDS